MAPVVLHHPRIALDAARVAVAAAQATDDVCDWFGLRLAELCGPAYQSNFWLTRDFLARTTRLDGDMVEVGRWRFRFEDLLGTHPDLADDLRILRLHANARLTTLQPI